MRKNLTNDTIFTGENDLSFYLLGAIITDGTVKLRKNRKPEIRIGSIDYEWIVFIRDLIVPNAKIHKRISLYKDFYTVEWSSEIIANWLISYGCKPRKSKTVKLEKEIPKQYQCDFLRGVIDGDGCICASQYTKKLKSGIKTYPTLSLYITTGSKIFGEQLIKMIEPLCKCVLYTKNIKEIVMKNGKIIKPTTYWNVQSAKIELKNCLDKIYYHDNRINLTRKQKIVDQYCRLM